MNFMKLQSVVGRILKTWPSETLPVSSVRWFSPRSTSVSTPTSENNQQEQFSDVWIGRRIRKDDNFTVKRINRSDAEEYKIKGDPDTFGNYEDLETLVGDEGDQIEEKFLKNPPYSGQKLRTKQYADLIKKCIKEKRFGDAIDVLETRMYKEDRVKPETYLYNLLIGACGRWGYSKKAFQLYNQMKKRGVKVNDPTYTGLMNSCANSPWPQDGLKRITQLREQMIEKGVVLNTTHYHAMIKAFGRCGDLNMAFGLVDEMINNQLKLDARTFSVLLQSCIADKEAGFRHSILVWRKMQQKKVKPDVFTYNLMLRCVRDCGIGDSDVAQDVLEQISENTKSISLLGLQKQLLVDSGSKEPENRLLENSGSEMDNKHIPAITEVCDNQFSRTDEDDQGHSRENRPNLLAPVPHLGNIIQISEVTRPQDRLMLIGGCQGVLQLIAADGLKPDVKTITLLLDCIPPTLTAEKALLSAMEKNKIQPDIDFFNMLIKKRSMRFDYANAKEVLKLVQDARLHPDIVTFGVLALGCQTEEEARQLIHDMRVAGYRLNIEILGAMLYVGCVKHDFHYILKIMYLCKEENVKPSALFLKYLEDLNTSCWDILHNKANDRDVPEYVQSKKFKKEFRTFYFKYKSWMKEIEPEEGVHPWDQFRQKSTQKDRETGPSKMESYNSV